MKLLNQFAHTDTKQQKYRDISTKVYLLKVLLKFSEILMLTAFVFLSRWRVEPWEAGKSVQVPSSAFGGDPPSIANLGARELWEDL